jgi:tRNA(adenine34) deaminase
VLDDQELMRAALEQARMAAAMAEVPVGAVVVAGDGRIIARAHNRRETDADPLAHAELLALAAAAAAREDWRLCECTVYVTLEPCAMCAGALVNSRVRRLVYGAPDPKAGYCGSLGDIVRDSRLNHRLEVSAGVLAEECSRTLRDFFGALRRGGGVRAGGVASLNTRGER